MALKVSKKEWEEFLKWKESKKQKEPEKEETLEIENDTPDITDLIEEDEEEETYICPQCGYESNKPFEKCPNCGARLKWD